MSNAVGEWLKHAADAVEGFFVAAALAVSDWFKSAVWAVRDFFVRVSAAVKNWANDIADRSKVYMHKFIYRRWVRKTIYYVKVASLPGNKGVPIYDVLKYFLTSLFNGSIVQRAKGLAYSFLAALPPLLLFFFTLVAYFPVDGLQDELVEQLNNIMPGKITDSISYSINDIMGHRHSTLLSIGFISSIILAANGMNGVIKSLNFANKSVEKRPFAQRYMLCILMVFVMYIIIVLMLCLLIGYKYMLQFLVNQGWIRLSSINALLFNIVRWVLLSLTTLLAVSFIYYYAPAKRQRVGFFSAGSVLATGMFFVFSWGLGVYLNNFNRYNLLYGSIGTMLMLMFWMYFNCIVLLVGYELNISIYNGTTQMKNRENADQIRQIIQKKRNDNSKRPRESGADRERTERDF